MTSLWLLALLPARARDDGTCGAWHAAETLGEVESAALTEVSGLCASHLDPGTLWLHNDHGGDRALHAADLSSADLGLCELVGVENEDWEDLAPGPCPDPEAEPCTCLYLADIGDNALARGGGAIHLVAEPGAPGAGGWTQSSPLRSLHFAYPDGPHDAETLLVHPDTGEVLVLTKGDETGVYAFPTVPPEPGTAADPVELRRVASFDLREAGAQEAQVTGGAVSPRGWRVVLRTDEDLVLFTGAFGASLESVLNENPVPLPTPPPGRGEAVAFGADGRRLYLVGEGSQPEIWAVDCASFQSDGEDAWDPLVDCAPGCGCAGARPRPALLSALLLALGIALGRAGGAPAGARARPR